MRGTVFDVKKFAVHDGPGIRTTLFVKGCPLNCIWCHNPEGISRALRLWYFQNKCIGCGGCIRICPEAALSTESPDNPAIIIDHGKCTGCGLCVEECPTTALSFDGREIEHTEAVRELLQDRPFYEKSGGGITLSGGDPVLQYEFSLAVLKGCREAGVHTAIETSMYAKEEVLMRFIDFVDLFIVDIKLFDAEAHRRYTGTGNQLILSNFRKLAEAGCSILVRIPLIPGITDSEDNLSSIASFVSGVSAETPIELINFNPLAGNKYRIMHADAGHLKHLKPFSEDEMEHFRSILTVNGAKVLKETKRR